jgi:HSP20 family molecular chaperone IbpA
MSNVAVEKARNSQDAPSLFKRMKAIGDKIRERAYELFQRRGRGDGFALDDWLNAQRDVVLSPESELIEKDGKFRVRMAVPGFDAKDIQITALPGALIVSAEASHKQSKSKGDVYFCEFGEKQMFRSLDLPAPINPDKVTADLEQGILHITAEKTVDAANNVKVISAA